MDLMPTLIRQDRPNPGRRQDVCVYRICVVRIRYMHYITRSDVVATVLFDVMHALKVPWIPGWGAATARRGSGESKHAQQAFSASS